MASNSLKDVSKLLANAFSSSTLGDSGLPDSVEQSILLQTGKIVTIDDVASQRLHDDLVATYNKYVANERSKLPAFSQALKHLRPHLLGQNRKFEWWRLVLRPILEDGSHKRTALENVRTFLLETLDFDLDADKKKGGELAKESAFFAKLLLECYLKRTSAMAAENEEYSPRDDHAESELEHILIQIGHRKPKVFLLTMDGIVVNKVYRLQALGLLSSFARDQPCQLSQVSQTPLVEHLIQCLMTDLSSSVLLLALTILLMFLPHIPSYIFTHLPRLFLIYSRLLCWDQLDHDSLKKKSSNDAGQDTKQASSWDVLRSADDQTEPKSIDVSFCFTFLYGLYPLNFTSFIRKPRRYLKDVKFPRAEALDIDQATVKHRSENFRRVHLLHPHFFDMTMEEELSETDWQKKDPSAIVAECMSLRRSPYPGLEEPRPPPSSKLPDPPGLQTLERDIPHQILDDGSADDSKAGDRRPSGVKRKPAPERSYDKIGLNRKGSARYPKTYSPGSSPRRSSKSEAGDSPTLPPVPQIPAQAADSRRRNNVMAYVHVADKPLVPTETADPSRAHLAKQLILLRNEVNFERFLKAQHLAHISSLQRRHLNDATLSTNTEELLNNNRTLKAKLAKANESYAALKKEIATGRNQSKQFETDLSTRVRTLRESERGWRVEEENLRAELAKAQRDCESLQKILAQNEIRGRQSEQQISSKSVDLQQVDTLQQDLHEEEEKVRILESREAELKQAAKGKEVLELELVTTNMELESKSSAYDRARKAYERRIAELETELEGRLGSAMNEGGQEGVEAALTTANTRVQGLKADYAQLKHEHVELEMRCQELEHKAADGFGRGKPSARASTPSPQRRPLSMVSDEMQSPGYSSSAGSGAMASRRNTGQSSRQRDSGAPSIASSTSTKNPPLPLRRTASGETMASDVASTGGSLYMHSKSAFSAESIASDQSEGSRSSRKLKMGLRSETGSLRSEKTEAEKMKEKRQKAAMKKQGGGLRGLRGII